MNARCLTSTASALGRSAFAAVVMLAAVPSACPSAVAADAISGTNARPLVGTLFAVTDRDLSLADQAASDAADRALFTDFQASSIVMAGASFPRPASARPASLALRFDRVRAGEPTAAAAMDRVDLFPLSRMAVPMLVAFLPEQGSAGPAVSPRPLVGPSVGMRTTHLRVGSFGGR